MEGSYRGLLEVLPVVENSFAEELKWDHDYGGTEDVSGGQQGKSEIGVRQWAR